MVKGGWRLIALKKKERNHDMVFMRVPLSL